MGKAANSSPSPWSEAQATDFDQNKTALTRVHYSDFSGTGRGAAAGLGLRPAHSQRTGHSVGGGQGLAEGGVDTALARTARAERRSEDFFFNQLMDLTGY